MVQLHQVVGERQSDARARGAHAPVVAVEEPGEHLGPFVLGDTNALIAHRECSLALVVFERHPYISAFMTIFDGVGHEVVEHLVHLVGIHPCPYLLLRHLYV